MWLGRVVGMVVSTVKDEKMRDLKLQIVQALDQRGGSTDEFAVAVDAVGAGPGDRVLVATGSSARQTGLTDGRPCDATIMAIVDSWDVGGEVVYRAHGER